MFLRHPCIGRASASPKHVHAGDFIARVEADNRGPRPRHACPLENPAASATVFNLKCAQDCAKNGSPLIILTSKGEIYSPISGSMPDKDQRQRLVPFVGKYVQATGTVYERSGTRAIVITEIHERKDVHLVTDAQ